MLKNKTLKAMALVGATGTGKSSLALELAQSKNTCIISCDSMQVYRGLNIGTSKASVEEQGKVHHHLIDCTNTSNIWNAQIWANAAKVIIKQENEQGKIPIIVGGTGMYLKALTHGFVDIPAEKQGLREHYESIQKKYGTPYLYQRLLAVDIPLAERLKEGDTQRIIRGLCVFDSTKKRLSEWHQQQDKVTMEAQNTLHCPVFSLEVSTDKLRVSIANRFHQMLAMGWLEETKWLMSLSLPETHPVMRAVGYRQLLDYFENKLSLDQAIEAGITATRRYAKRQRTWFRNQTPHAQRGKAVNLIDLMKREFD
ncbi:MAG: tRNA (adenosine(37)-N6)-dimethylallyltransferase MiaA [Ghiorsea sp.]|nr:tRNA (adenosine(37)-N6)-dimethylallyltransferase MiaA [Ghiorsea sp.]